MKWFNVRIHGDLDAAYKALTGAGIVLREAFAGYGRKLNVAALRAVVEAKSSTEAIADVRRRLPGSAYELEASLLPISSRATRSSRPGKQSSPVR